jgi:N-acyl-D-amino-acid deacylase
VLDLIIKGGTVVDGTGSHARVADIGIAAGHIVEIGEVRSPAHRSIDVEGLLVTPGFVDIHTHYDGQATWDDALYPSFDNGVTTAIVGNCGVGFAPVHSHERELLVDLMDGVEEIPGSALAVGLKWDWQTFPQYLDALERMRHSFNIGALATHGPLRIYTMGEKVARRDPPSAAELQAMCELLDQSMQAGAWGLSSSRTPVHTSRSGKMTPDFEAGLDELRALSAVVGRYRGVFEFAPFGNVGEDLVSLKRDMVFYEDLARNTQSKVHLLLSQTLTYPDFWREQLAMIDRVNADGHQIYGQIHGRGIGVMLGFENSNPFQTRPTFQAVTRLPRSLWLREFAKSEIRNRILAEKDNWPSRLAMMSQMLAASYIYAGAEDYEPTVERKVVAVAAREGRTIEEVGYDWMASGKYLFAPMLNYANGNLEPTETMLDNPACILAASDAGAHSLTVCDGALPTFMMTHWARDRKGGKHFSVERIVEMLSSKPARSIGLLDRGTIACGMRADINVIDFERLSVQPINVIDDLPSGASRLLQGAEGYRATVVNGIVTREHDEDTGARPGLILRRH